MEPRDAAPQERYLAEIAELVAAFAGSGAIAAAGELVADCWQRGGRVMVSKTHHILHHEGTLRAGGPLGIAVLEEEGDFYDCERILNLEPHDIVLIHTSYVGFGMAVGIAMRARELGNRSIALSQVGFDHPSLLGHPSGKRLVDVVDVHVDLGGVAGDGVVDLPGTPVRVAPSSGVTGMVAFWMIVAAASGLLTDRGKTPLVLQSLFYPGAAERNQQALADWRRTGLPFRDTGYEA
jgi:uncharacterized phosphosugar-binding protein